jgi:glycine cleavage system H lipoate-binding protein
VASVKAANGIYTPINGPSACSQCKAPELVNEPSNTEGWFIRIRIENPFKTDVLMGKNEYLASITD